MVPPAPTVTVPVLFTAPPAKVIVPPPAPVPTAPELLRLPVRPNVEPAWTETLPVELTLSVPVPGVTDVVPPFASVTLPSTLASLPMPLAEATPPISNVPPSVNPELALISVMPFGWLTRFSVAPEPMFRFPAVIARVLIEMLAGVEELFSVRVLPLEFRIAL
jgi:hypothetical protein